MGLFSWFKRSEWPTETKEVTVVYKDAGEIIIGKGHGPTRESAQQTADLDKKRRDPLGKGKIASTHIRTLKG